MYLQFAFRIKQIEAVKKLKDLRPKRRKLLFLEKCRCVPKIGSREEEKCEENGFVSNPCFFQQAVKKGEAPNHYELCETNY